MLPGDTAAHDNDAPLTKIEQLSVCAMHAAHLHRRRYRALDRIVPASAPLRRTASGNTRSTVLAR
ncbi:hypothetical protein ASF73_18630 [Xanthomonas sp. Leaf131]|nr:hypothetical protein ASF73_18630 [Xanthomonas sp. Leaf131]